MWFFLPPPDEERRLKATRHRASDLYALLLGRPHQLDPVYQRLREKGIRDPTAAEQVVENLTGIPSDYRQWSYRERRQHMLLALLDQHADQFDTAMDQIGEIVDHLRQTGIRGFVAEQTRDEDLTHQERPSPANPPDQPATTEQNETAPVITTEDDEAPGGTT
jgi:hypothetical protein